MSLVKARLEQGPAPEVLSPGQIANRLNKIGREIRSAGISKMRETYNLSRNALAPYIVLRRASYSNLSASLQFRVRALPIEAFKPRVEMRPVQIKTRRGTRVQKLPHVLLQRYVGKAAKVIPSAFPLRQRRTGRLKSGEQVRRRISKLRGRLTRLRYYVFPERYLFGKLLPHLKSLAGAAIGVQFRNAVRRGGVLRRNSASD